MKKYIYAPFIIALFSLNLDIIIGSIVLVLVLYIIFSMFDQKQIEDRDKLVNDFNSELEAFIIFLKNRSDLYNVACESIDKLFNNNSLSIEIKKELRKYFIDYTDKLFSQVLFTISIMSKNKPINPLNVYTDIDLKKYSSLFDKLIVQLLSKYDNQKLPLSVDGNVTAYFNYLDESREDSHEKLLNYVTYCYNEIDKSQKNIVDLLKENIFSFNREDYIIENEDYKRNNSTDRLFHQHFKGYLLQLYENRCAKCGKLSTLEVDHFIIPKCYGGNFILRHKEGYNISNAIPLCKTCNVLKLDNPYNVFFTIDEINNILKINDVMTALLNKTIDEKQFLYYAKKIRKE